MIHISQKPHFLCHGIHKFPIPVPGRPLRNMQLHGGTGYMHGTEVERHYRDAHLLGIGGGAIEVLDDLAARLLGYGS